MRALQKLVIIGRIAAKIRIDPVTGCWLWTGAKSQKGEAGYGVMWNPETHRVTAASRMSYRVFVRPIREGLEPDHLCRRTLCVHPLHLEPVTHRVNMLRGRTFAAANAAKTHCIHGHAFNFANTYNDPLGRRQCRVCGRIRARHYLKLRRQRQ